MERFFKTKIQDLFEASKLVLQQENHEGNSISMEAIESIGELGRDLFDEDGNRKKFIRGVIPSRASVQRAAEGVSISMEDRLKSLSEMGATTMPATTTSADGQCVKLNLEAVLRTIIEDGGYDEAGYSYPHL